MKKLLGCMLIVVLLCSSCVKNGKDGNDTVFMVLDFDIPSINNNNKWNPVFDDVMGNFFESRVSIRELTGDIFDNGAVLCYLLQNVNYGARTTVIQTPLPYTFFGEFGGFLYSENYTFELSPGSINFIVKISDFDIETQMPLDCTFRVVLMR